MYRQPLFITFEGIDGSGKTTQIKLLKDYFEKYIEKNEIREIVVTREPGGTGIGEKIRNILLDSKNDGMSAMTEVLLYAASRAQHIEEVIKPALQSGKIVICDRFLDSSIAYQSAARGISAEIVAKINGYAVSGILPDITILLDADAGYCLNRRLSQTTPDRLENEKLAFFEKVREGYLKLAECHPERIWVINADDDAAVIHDKILSIIKDRRQ